MVGLLLVRRSINARQNCLVSEAVTVIVTVSTRYNNRGNVALGVTVTMRVRILPTRFIILAVTVTVAVKVFLKLTIREKTGETATASKNFRVIAFLIVPVVVIVSVRK